MVPLPTLMSIGTAGDSSDAPKPGFAVTVATGGAVVAVVVAAAELVGSEDDAALAVGVSVTIDEEAALDAATAATAAAPSVVVQPARTASRPISARTGVIRTSGWRTEVPKGEAHARELPMITDDDDLRRIYLRAM